MIPLINDIVMYICDFLDEYSKIQWLSTCKQHHALIGGIIITQQVVYSKVRYFKHKEIFTSLLVDDWETTYEAWSVPAGFENLRSLAFGMLFNRPVNLPEGLQHVRFKMSFSQPVVLPSTLKSVNFGMYFDREILLPDGLLHAHFGYCFNKPIRLPNGLLSVSFDGFFNQPIKLPASLREVIFGNYFHQSVKLPAGLQRATFYNDKYDIMIDFPPSLRELTISSHYAFPIPDGITVNKY